MTPSPCRLLAPWSTPPPALLPFGRVPTTVAGWICAGPSAFLVYADAPRCPPRPSHQNTIETMKVEMARQAEESAKAQLAALCASCPKDCKDRHQGLFVGTCCGCFCGTPCGAEPRVSGTHPSPRRVPHPGPVGIFKGWNCCGCKDRTTTHCQLTDLPQVIEKVGPRRRPSAPWPSGLNGP